MGLTVSLIVLLFFSACGSSDKKNTATTQQNTSTAQPSLADFKGVYVATLKNPELSNAAGPRARWPTGLWRMAFGTRDPKTARTPGNVNDLLQNTLEWKEGQVGDPLKTGNAYYIFRRGAAVPKTFEDAKQELLVTLGQWRGP